MPKPRTKTQIIASLQTERLQLEHNLADLTSTQMVQPNVVGEWSIKDVLAHLADWESHMLLWIAAARQGDPVAEIESGLNWAQFEEFNQRIYERHKDQSVEEVLTTFRDIHLEFMKMVEEMPDVEMLEQRRYRFLENRAVYDWLNSYAGHDRWAKTHIRKWIKLIGN